MEETLTAYVIHRKSFIDIQLRRIACSQVATSQFGKYCLKHENLELYQWSTCPNDSHTHD